MAEARRIGFTECLAFGFERMLSNLPSMARDAPSQLNVRRVRGDRPATSPAVLQGNGGGLGET